VKEEEEEEEEEVEGVAEVLPNKGEGGDEARGGGEVVVGGEEGEMMELEEGEVAEEDGESR